nr:PREDICTED: uncharacterized protein LOC108212644 [Daucus carota subsp. sativus]
MAVESQKKEAAVVSHPDIVANDQPVLSLKEKLKNMKEGPGSMAAYLEMRELEIQKEIPQAESEMPDLQSQPDTPDAEIPKKKRGKTRMDHVHNSNDKKIITLNELSQPVSDNSKLLSEFSNFLGTTVRQFVSLTCVSWHEVPEKDLLWEYVKEKYIIPEEAKPWVLKTMNDQFRSYKSRIKRDYYYPYPTDEERLENRPKEVPLADWKLLLKYWADGKTKRTAAKNIVARQKIIETHTTGPTSFAQITNKLRLKKLEEEKLHDADVGCEGKSVHISDADIYLETRKRDSKREYKLPKKVLEKVTEKIDDVKKALATEGEEAANKLVYGEKEHSPSYLIGRLIQKKEPKSKASAAPAQPPDEYVNQLTAKIKAQLQQEMEEKFDKKLQDMMKLLAEKNPSLNINVNTEDPQKSDEMPNGDDNIVTP